MADFYMPRTLADALVIRKREDVQVVAGGTDIYVRRHAEGDSGALMSLSRLSELHEIRVTGECVHVGSTVTYAQLASHEISDRIPALKKAVLGVGTPQVRNRGTIGGSLCHANPAADLVPLWMVLDAEAVLGCLDSKGALASRRLPIQKLIHGVGKTALQPGELLLAVEFPIPKGEICYEKVGRRNAAAVARLNAAVSVAMADGLITATRICIGTVSPTPRYATAAQKVIENRRPDNSLFRSAAEAAADEMIPDESRRDSYPYKKALIRNLVEEALAELTKERP